MFGFLNINKSSGRSSRDVVNAVQKLVKPHKIGHAGTLDPLATGVLVVCIGPATRLTQYVQQQPKTYVADFRLGVRSETEDVESELVAIKNAPDVSEDKLRIALKPFVGNIMQLPPKYSALKVNGKRAYDLARKGKTVELKPRPIQVYELELNAFSYPHFTVTIQCGAGTYVRSLGRDIGEALGSGAVMTKLERTAIGDFSIQSAISDSEFDLEQVERSLVAGQKGISNSCTEEAGSAQFPRVQISQDLVAKLATGHTWSPPEPMDSKEVLAIDEQDRLIAVLKRIKPDLYSPRINFANYWLS